MVIVIDGTNKLDVIQHALIYILLSLRAIDRIAIRPTAAFKTGHDFPIYLYINCDECGLLQVNSENINILHKWIYSLEPSGKQTSNEDFINLAFGFECDTGQKKNRQRFLLSFPGGAVESNQSILSKKIKDENEKKDIYDIMISYRMHVGTDTVNLKIISYVDNEILTKDESYDDWDDSKIK